MTDEETNTKERKNKLITFDGIKDVFNTILVNMIDQVTMLEKNISLPYSEETEQSLDHLDSKNDYFIRLLRENLLRGIFLPINKHDLRQTIEKFETLIDLLQRVGHHLWLIQLPDWINEHLVKMIEIINQELVSLNNWFTLKRETPEEIDEISKLENEADKLHRSFLRKLYSQTLEYRIFTQASLLDQTFEDITDEIENLSRLIHVILNEYRTMLRPLPHYLP